MTCRAEDKQRKKTVVAGRNPQRPTAASCGVINTNAHIIILQLPAKYGIGTF
jgi:hypothetical protein